MKNVRTLLPMLTGLSIVAGTTGCKSDLEVSAPYKEITVVYGLLSKNDDTCWLKINKAFLGEGNALEYAQIPDSNEYTDAQFDGTISTTDGSQSWTLQETIVNRPVGIFNGPQHKMYYFVPGAGGLNEDATYRLDAIAKGNVVNATTPLVKDFNIYSTTSNPNTLINFKTGNGFVNYEIQWFTAGNGKRYEVTFTFFYDEKRSDGSITGKSFTAPVATFISDGQVNDQVGVALNGENFFQTVAARVPEDDDVVYRQFQGIEFNWAVAGPDLHTYLALSEPISGIVEERPDYTNINGGYGLLSSRIFKSTPQNANSYATRKRLGPLSMTELLTGSYTGSRRFCIPGVQDCPQ